MLNLTQHNGKTIFCQTWADVRKNLTVYVSPGEMALAQSMMECGGYDSWNFIYGFCFDRVSKEAAQ